MGKTVLLRAGKIEAEVQLNDTRTAQTIWEALPLKGYANLWGDEIYFSIPLSLQLEAGQESVSIGDLGYWPAGNAFCIFFGPTPISPSREIRAASQVTIFGKVIGDATVFKKVPSGMEMKIWKNE